MKTRIFFLIPVFLWWILFWNIAFAVSNQSPDSQNPALPNNKQLVGESQLVNVEMKLNIPMAFDMGEVIITSSNPAGADKNVMNCFDGRPESTFISNGQEAPSRVQVQFLKSKPVTKVKTLIGEPGFEHITNNWWLEAANSQEDLNSQMGSYQMVVQSREVAGNWDEVTFRAPVNRKIWKFSVKKNAYDECVQVHELEIWAEI